MRDPDPSTRSRYLPPEAEAEGSNPSGRTELNPADGAESAGHRTRSGLMAGASNSAPLPLLPIWAPSTSARRRSFSPSSRRLPREPLTVAGLKLDREGIYVGFGRRSGNLVDWGNVEDLRLDGGKVVIGVRTAKGREFKLRTSTKLPNAVVLPHVLAEMRSRLGFEE